MIEASQMGFSALLMTLLSLVLVCSVSAQGCSTLTEMYTMSGTITFSNTSALGAHCYRVMPQPKNKAQEVTSISFQLDPTYSIGQGEINVYSSWFPMPEDRYLVNSYTDCCDPETAMTVKAPRLTFVFNTTYDSFNTFDIKYVADNTKFRTKFSLGLFQGSIVAICAPIAALLFSYFTFRRGFCDKTGQHRRLSRKTPFAERITTLAVSIFGMLLFLLLTFRVFG